MELKDYLALLIPLIGVIISVGIPGILSYIKIRKQEKAAEEDRLAQADGSVADTADTQVGTSLDLVNKLQELYEDVSKRLEAAELTNKKQASRIGGLEQAEKSNSAIIAELRFEQRVSSEHGEHLIDGIKQLSSQVKGLGSTPRFVPKSRDQIAQEIRSRDDDESDISKRH